MEQLLGIIGAGIGYTIVGIAYHYIKKLVEKYRIK